MAKIDNKCMFQPSYYLINLHGRDGGESNRLVSNTSETSPLTSESALSENSYVKDTLVLLHQDPYCEVVAFILFFDALPSCSFMSKKNHARYPCA